MLYTVTETTDNVGPITCTAVCIPDCTMTWDGPNLLGGTTSVLDLQNINKNQAGDYQCTAINSIGSRTSDIVTVIVNCMYSCIFQLFYKRINFFSEVIYIKLESCIFKLVRLCICIGRYSFLLREQMSLVLIIRERR